MGVIMVKRPPRAYPPAVPDEPVELVPPPELPRSGGEDWVMSILPMLGMGGSAVFFFAPGAQAPMKIMGGLMIVSTVGMALAQIVRARKGGSTATADERRDYLKYLQQMRRQVRRTAERQRGAQLFLNPSRTSSGRSSPTAGGCGSGGAATPTSRRSGSAADRSSCPPRWSRRRPRRWTSWSRSRRPRCRPS